MFSTASLAHGLPFTTIYLELTPHGVAVGSFVAWARDRLEQSQPHAANEKHEPGMDPKNKNQKSPAARPDGRKRSGNFDQGTLWHESEAAVATGPSSSHTPDATQKLQIGRRRSFRVKATGEPFRICSLMKGCWLRGWQKGRPTCWNSNIA
jgi:hypothetical protein